MKKIILSIVVAAFAVSVQAGGDDACGTKAEGGSCCAAKQATQAKADLKACPVAAKQANGTCQAKNAKIAKKQLKSPKALAEARS